MKAKRNSITSVALLILFSGVSIIVCAKCAHADDGPGPFMPKAGQGQAYENYIDQLERESDRIDAETSLRSLELSLYEQILTKRAELRRLEREISAAKQASLEAVKPPAEKLVEKPCAEAAPREEVTKEFVSIFPEDMKPGTGEVLVALVHLKRGEVKEVRVLDESADSILAEIPLGKISIRKGAIKSVQSQVYPEEEYRFKLGDYYDNVPSSRSYYIAIAQYNKVLDINPKNQRAKEKLEKCQKELAEILERERKQERRVRQRPPEAPEPVSNQPVASQEPARYDVSQQTPASLEVLCYHMPVVPRHRMVPYRRRFGIPRTFGWRPPAVPLDVNGSILLVPFF